MRFAERYLKPYAEPISATELHEDSVYFSVSFVDGDMHIPVIETLVFVGRNDKGLLQFQDVESYRQKVNFASSSNDLHAVFIECSEDQLNNVFEFERALDVLLRCSLRRRAGAR